MFKIIFYIYILMTDPNAWGKHGWKFIHYVALGYPNDPTTNDKLIYKNFLSSIEYILPCKKCRDHFTEYIKTHPIDDSVLNDQQSFLDWTLELHNKVNEVSGKKPVPLDVARKFVKDDSCQEPIIENKINDNIDNTLINNSNNTTNSYSHMYLIIFLVIITIVFIYITNKK